MQPSNIKTPKQALNPAFLKQRPEREEIELFKKEFITLLNNINEKESEEFHKNLVSQFLNTVYYKDNHFINTKGYADLVIHNGKDAKSPVAVLIEAKSPTNKTEMVSEKNLNVKSFQELVLYYLRERKTGKNFELRYLIVTNVYEWFIFDAQEFEKLFYQDKKLLKKFEEFEAGKLSGTSTDFFYKEIATPAIEEIKQQIVYTHFDIRKYDKILRDDNKDNDKGLIALYKFLSPIHLLKLSFANDYNQLNKEFYAELLHIMGLEEIKDKSQKYIVRKSKDNRDNGSIIENTINELDSMIDFSRIPNINQYGKTSDERLFNIALDLCITWINRVLFLKLLEAQIIKYNNNDKRYSFLSTDKLEDGYDDLNRLFFQILARKEEERREGSLKKKFSHVPYLNSSLFERTNLEADTIVISNLPNSAKIELYSKSILKKRGSNDKLINNLTPLDYLLKFLDAYDFSSEGAEEIQEENKPLISASVLGLIFEKINGYKDGSFFTPSYITMFMCRDTITRTVIQKFNNIKGWECQTTNDLYNKITDIKEANEIYNSVRICDPAVGSGHFLVSSLNELIYLKSELGILVDKEGRKLKDYRLSIENDELIISDSESGIFKYEPHKHESQRIQETLFHEKQTIIENCLFGVDLNPNSVKICQLRLWIELLKHTYYKSNSKNLETLPNIDINIKCGNSLISRFGLEEDLKPALRKLGYTIADYQHAVDSYRNAHNKEEKRELNELIQTIKSGLKTEIAIKDPLIVKLSKKRGQLQSLDQLGLFEEKVSKSKKQSIEKLKKEIQQISTQIEEIKNNVIYQNALEWRLEFPEVLDKDGNFIGFDAIVGNPPYIRIQGIKESDSQLADAYKDIYTSATGSYDIYSLFVEKTLSLIKTNGIINFIMPTKWTNASFGKGVRTIIAQNKNISKMINFGSFQVFDASTYTGLQWFEKNSNYLQYLELEEDSVQSDNELYCFLKNIETSHFNKISSDSLTPEPWILSHGHIMKIIDKLNEQPRRISDVFNKIFQGLATSRDDVYFLYDCVEKDNLIEGYSKELSKSILIEKELVKPLLKGEDVHRYQKIITDRVVIFPYKKLDNEATLYTEEELSTQFPLGYSYLKECEEILRGREKGRFNIDGEWFQFGRKQGINFAEFEKLVAPEISKGGNFAYDKKGEFYSTTKNYGYILNEEVDESYLFWLGLLNSQLFWFFIQNTGYVLRGGYYTFKTNYITPFPIPASIPFPISKQIENLVNQILSIKEVTPKSCTMEQEKMIDILIYELYNLTTDDIKVIEYTK